MVNPAMLLRWSRDLGLETKAGATVLPFTQPPEVCATLCALWIRRQLKSKTLFDAKRLYRPVIDERESDEFEIQPAFRTKLDTLHTQIQKYSVGQIEPAYITTGRNEPILKVDKASTKVSRNFATTGESPPKDINKSGSGLLRTFESVYDKTCVGAIGYHFQTRSHAIALDCSKNDFKAIFFDPLIGQFSFAGFNPFLDWWFKCWDDKLASANGNAWFFIREDKQVTLQLYGEPE